MDATLQKRAYERHPTRGRGSWSPVRQSAVAEVANVGLCASNRFSQVRSHGKHMRNDPTRVDVSHFRFGTGTTFRSCFRSDPSSDGGLVTNAGAKGWSNDRITGVCGHVTKMKLCVAGLRMEHSCTKSRASSNDHRKQFAPAPLSSTCRSGPPPERLCAHSG